MPAHPPKQTPAKRPFTIPTGAMTKAIEKEWTDFETFSPSAMPITSLVFTAIDQVSQRRDAMVEVLMAYVDTDTLCYRSENKDLLAMQKKQWDPMLAWAGDRFNALWQTTTGIMPLSQSEALNEAVSEHLGTLDDMRLTACGMLASLYSSLILALAVLEKRLSAEEAFTLSQLEEDWQAIHWGKDAKAQEKKQRLQAEIMEISRFLRLLEQA